MSAHCHSHSSPPATDSSPRYRRILWIALILNFTMFGIEIGSSVLSNSVALFADAIDFLGDGLNYGVALLVIGIAPVWSSRAALVKALSMLGFGLFVLLRAAWNHYHSIVPEALTMGAVSLLALSVNLAVAWMLYQYCEGNANMRSVWLCTRNDALSNLAVLGAALGVLGTRAGWPDLTVAIFMAGLALHSGAQVLRLAHAEIKATTRAQLAIPTSSSHCTHHADHT
jgi:Co/Zn/Cd efflux system component